MQKASKIVLAVVAVAAIVGAYVYPKYPKLSVNTNFGTSATGSTFSNAKFYGVAIDLSAGTSTAILNTDANSRYIADVKVGCSGLGTSKNPITGTALTNLTYTAATTSAAQAVPPGSVNAAVALNAPIATTSSPWFVSATTTIPGQTGALATSSLANVWASGSYLNFWFNATNTGACTIGVDTIGS